MKEEKTLPWIHVGYELFAQDGPKALKVEVIARLVNKSKSSFYHHFADLEVFTELLFQYHLERAAIMGEREAACKNVDPELLEVLIEFKQDLFFNRQLRVNRHVPAFKQCFEKAGEIVGNSILGIWAEMLGLDGKSHLANIVLGLTIENFFLQMTEETMNYEWLSNYIKEIQFMVSQLGKQAS